MKTVCFVDCHFHLFNIADVPLYATLEATAEGISTLTALGAALMSNKADSALYGHKELLLFFERSIVDNIEFLVQQIIETLDADGTDKNKLKILTPLVMDFDLIAPTFEEQVSGYNALEDRNGGMGYRGKDAMLKDRKGQKFGLMMPSRTVADQVGRLRDAIKARRQWLDERGFKIFHCSPIVGHRN